MARLDFLLYDGPVNNGKMYRLTEKAIAYVDNLRKEELSEQAKEMLRKLAENEELNLFYNPNTKSLLIDTYGTTMISPEFLVNGNKADTHVDEDLDILVKKGYLTDTTLAGKYRYSITRDGARYIKNFDKKL